MFDSWPFTRRRLDRRIFLASATATVLAANLHPLASSAQKAADSAFLRFNMREDHVELQETRGLLELNGEFTIEAWVRWDGDAIDKTMSILGDEAWPGMSQELPVSKPCGFVIRTSRIEDADKRSLELNVAASIRGKSDWFTVKTALHRVSGTGWQHVAVSKTPDLIRLFWNGKRSAQASSRGIRFHSAPSNLYLGVRRGGFSDRDFRGDFRAFRVSSKARYVTDFKPDEILAKDAATLLLLDFSAADDSRVPDVSGNNRHGLIVGAKPTKAGQQ